MIPAVIEEDTAEGEAKDEDEDDEPFEGGIHFKGEGETGDFTLGRGGGKEGIFSENESKKWLSDYLAVDFSKGRAKPGEQRTGAECFLRMVG